MSSEWHENTCLSACVPATRTQASIENLIDNFKVNIWPSHVFLLTH